MDRCCAFLLSAALLLASAGTGRAGQGMDIQGKPSDTLVVGRVIFSGNHVTRERILIRELGFKPGDRLDGRTFGERTEQARRNIFNTRLFNLVTLDTVRQGTSDTLDIRIGVTERWYIWPIPFMEISDRNFNVWWESRQLRRLSYGVDLTFFNVRGRNETLSILLHAGFNQRYGFTYRIPSLDAKQKTGLAFGLSFDLNHEVPVFTRDNKPRFLRNDDALLKEAVTGFTELLFRPDLYTRHAFRMTYAHYRFDSSVYHLPGYLEVPGADQDFFTVTYRLKHDRRDVQYYPLDGYCADFEAGHTFPAARARNTWLWGNLRVYRPLGGRWYAATGLTGKVGLFGRPSYFLQRGLGYGRDYVRGYEYYVVDGTHYLLHKNDLKFALIPQHVRKLDFIRTPKFNTVPLALYLDAYLDLGYAGKAKAGDGAGNSLQNRLLTGFGMGVDFVTYYDVVIRVEGSVNHLFQPGIYLHFVAPI